MSEVVGDLQPCEYCGSFGNQHTKICVVLELAALRERIAELEAQNQRLHDLVRYKRHDLFDDGLITDDEFSELVQDHPAVARLEGYDAMKAERDRALSELAEARKALESICDPPLSVNNKKWFMQTAAAILNAIDARAATSPGAGSDTVPSQGGRD